MNEYDVKLTGDPNWRLVRADEFSVTDKGLAFYRKQTSRRKRGVTEKDIIENVLTHFYPFSEIERVEEKGGDVESAGERDGHEAPSVPAGDEEPGGKGSSKRPS